MSDIINNIDNHSSENITPITSKEIAEDIRSNLNPKKASAFDLAIGEILKHFNRKSAPMSSFPFSSAFRYKRVFTCWKFAEVVMEARKNNCQVPRQI